MKRRSVCPEQQFEENGFLKILFSFYLFPIFFKKQFGWIAKVLESCQNCILGVQRNHWCNWFPIIVFYSLPFGLWAKMFFGLLLEGLRPRCQNCVLCVQKGVLTKMFSKLWFFIVLGTCLNVFWLSDRTFSAGSSKLNFTCPGEHFKGSLILWKNIIVSFFSVSERKVRRCCRNCIRRVRWKFP